MRLKISCTVILLALLSVACTKKAVEERGASVNLAIQKNDKKALRKLISKNTINDFDSLGFNYLTRAVMSGELDLVKVLVKKGADPNLKNKITIGHTPLMATYRHRSTEIAAYLIEQGASLDIQDTNGDPAIHWAAYQGNLPLTKLLLDQGANTQLKSIHADGVMQVALKEFRDSIVNVLVDNGVSIHPVSEEEASLIQAVQSGHLEMLEKKLNSSNSNTRDHSSNTLVHIAVNNGNLKALRLLINHQADINRMNIVGQTPLCKASFLGHIDLVKLLLENGVHVNKTDTRFKLTPLIGAVRGNNLQIAETLLKNGANINDTDGVNGASPIMWAVIAKNMPMIKMLLRYEPDLSIVNKYGSTVDKMTADEAILKELKKLTE